MITENPQIGFKMMQSAALHRFRAAFSPDTNQAYLNGINDYCNSSRRENGNRYCPNKQPLLYNAWEEGFQEAKREQLTGT